MSGTITDMALRKCPACKDFYIEDDRMYLDTDRCPRCGADVHAARPFSFGLGSAGSTAAADAWELEDGSGFWETEDGSGFWESEA
jgi:rRNA maturation protein Nop10